MIGCPQGSALQNQRHLSGAAACIEGEGKRHVVVVLSRGLRARHPERADAFKAEGPFSTRSVTPSRQIPSPFVAEDAGRIDRSPGERVAPVGVVVDLNDSALTHGLTQNAQLGFRRLPEVHLDAGIGERPNCGVARALGVALACCQPALAVIEHEL